MSSALFAPSPRHSINPMAESISYPPSSHYSAYYASQPGVDAHTGYIGPQRTEPHTRRRPKYTRSKTGCLTCRVKKIKCDETKPNCIRCVHGQREQKEVQERGGPYRRRGRPSTAGSSGVSESSTPPTRDSPPLKHEPLEVGIPAMALRRNSDPYSHVLPSANDIGQRDIGHRTNSITSLLSIQQHQHQQHYAPLHSHSTSNLSHSTSSSLSHSGSSSMSHSASSSLTHSPSSVLSSIPEVTSAYQHTHSVNHRYSDSHHYAPPLSPPLISRSSHGSGYRHLDANQSSGSWHQSSISSHDDSLDSYYPPVHVHSRMLVSHASMDGYARYT
ncbi:hypothetical protein EVG20_g6772 [Dentipellis fragilis]|uniref:Zn(2)-C6 fungal-type domain-containing protein n=1 Tax=Dentipellis fragilis TaxID=205917 RepID=A0A4Y9YJT0_9AGAM|nr:hypothetical protein EVG20_g6772 [Dentipellis fragilis]